MRSFLGISKMLITVLIIAFVIKAIVVVVPSFRPIILLYNMAKSRIGADINNKGGNRIDIDLQKPDERIEAEENGEKVILSPESVVSSEQESKGNTDKGEVSDCEYFISIEEVGLAEDISLQDKLTALTIFSKLSASDVDKVIELASDGITYSEVKDLKRILERSLTANEIDKLDEILARNRRLYAEGKLAAR